MGNNVNDREVAIEILNVLDKYHVKAEDVGGIFKRLCDEDAGRKRRKGPKALVHDVLNSEIEVKWFFLANILYGIIKGSVHGLLN